MHFICVLVFEFMLMFVGHEMCVDVCVCVDGWGCVCLSVCEVNHCRGTFSSFGKKKKKIYKFARSVIVVLALEPCLNF